MSEPTKPRPHVSEMWDVVRELVTARREAERQLAEAQEEIRSHANWAREYGKTPDGQASLDWARKVQEAERQRDEARQIATSLRDVLLKTSRVKAGDPLPWEAK